MKSRSVLILILSLVFLSASNKSADYSKILPGVVKVTDYLYYDKTEVSNFSWLEYLYWTKKEFGAESAQYAKAYPDTNVWGNKLSYIEPYIKYYLQHEAYRGYPVVGVTWEQARDFCTWRTDRVKEVLEEQGKLHKAPQYFNYRLPTIAEWTMMYDDIKDLPNRIGDEGKRAYRGMFRYNMKRSSGDSMGQAGKLNDNADITAPVESYWPNSFGVYNIKGNVSEWLLEENIHIGGAWNTLTDADVSTSEQLDGTSALVGFRCVCEVAEEAP